MQSNTVKRRNRRSRFPDRRHLYFCHLDHGHKKWREAIECNETINGYAQMSVRVRGVNIIVSWWKARPRDYGVAFKVPRFYHGAIIDAVKDIDGLTSWRSKTYQDRFWIHGKHNNADVLYVFGDERIKPLADFFRNR